MCVLCSTGCMQTHSNHKSKSCGSTFWTCGRSPLQRKSNRPSLLQIRHTSFAVAAVATNPDYITLSHFSLRQRQNEETGKRNVAYCFLLPAHWGKNKRQTLVGRVCREKHWKDIKKTTTTTFTLQGLLECYWQYTCIHEAFLCTLTMFYYYMSSRVQTSAL